VNEMSYHRQNDEELKRFRAEAAELLGSKPAPIRAPRREEKAKKVAQLVGHHGRAPDWRSAVNQLVNRNKEDGR